MSDAWVVTEADLVEWAKANGYVRLDGVDTEALGKAWRYGVHTPTLPERIEAWAVVAAQIEAVLALAEGDTTK